MNTPTIPRRSAAIAVLLSGLLPLATGLSAQTNSGVPDKRGQLLEISLVIIKPDRTAEYERIQREEVNPALQKAGLEARSYFKGGFINDGYLYGTAVPIPNLAYFDRPRPLEQALGKSEAEALIARIAACHISKRVFVTRTIPDMSWGQLFSPVAVVVDYRLAPGRKAEFLKFLRGHMVPAVRKADLVGFTVEEQVLGGNIDQVTTLAFRQSYADLDKGPPAQWVLGEQGYQEMMQQLPAGVVMEREARVLEFLPHLSFGPMVKGMPDRKTSE